MLCWIHFRKIKIYLHFLSFLYIEMLKVNKHPFTLHINTTTVDDLMIQRARASALMTLTFLSWNITVSAPKGLMTKRRRMLRSWRNSPSPSWKHLSYSWDEILSCKISNIETYTHSYIRYKSVSNFVDLWTIVTQQNWQNENELYFKIQLYIRQPINMWKCMGA